MGRLQLHLLRLSSATTTQHHRTTSSVSLQPSKTTKKRQLMEAAAWSGLLIYDCRPAMASFSLSSYRERLDLLVLGRDVGVEVADLIDQLRLAPPQRPERVGVTDRGKMGS